MGFYFNDGVRFIKIRGGVPVEIRREFHDELKFVDL